MIGKFIFLGVVLLTLVSCKQSLDDQTEDFISYVRSHQYGTTSDVFIEAKSSLGESWSKVILVFGYHDDREACEELIVIMNKAYPETPHRCTSI